MKQYKVTLLRMERTVTEKIVEANSVFEAFEIAKKNWEQSFKPDGKGGGVGVQVDNVEPITMKGDKPKQDYE